MNANVTNEKMVLLPLNAIVGSFRSFGSFGPVYEVLRANGSSTGNSVMLRIRVVESGEELDYPLNEALDDPVSR